MTGVEEVVRADARWQEAMRKRGVTDFDLCMIDPWPAGYYGPQDHYDNSPLVCRPLTFVRAARLRARIRPPGRGSHRHRSTSTR